MWPPGGIDKWPSSPITSPSRVKAGDGGHGCASVHREKFKPLGGPDGGNGGRGGDVIFEVDPSMATLLDLHRRPVRRAGNGKQGSGSNRSGADGADLVVTVPDGTVVKTAGRRGARRPGGRRDQVRGRAGRPGRARQRGARLPQAPGPGVRAARRAGRRAHPGARAQDRGRRGPGRLPQRGQVLADLGHVRGPAQDRELPLHHAHPAPGHGGGGRDPVRGGRRARADSRREQRQGARPGLPAARGALRGAGARARLRRGPGRGAGPGSRGRPGHDRGGTGRLRRGHRRRHGRAGRGSSR